MTEFEKGRAAGLEEAARHIAALKNGFSIDVDTGALEPDEDGPWILNRPAASKIRALAPLPPTLVIVPRAMLAKVSTRIEILIRDMNEGTKCPGCENFTDHEPECMALALESILGTLAALDEAEGGK